LAWVAGGQVTWNNFEGGHTAITWRYPGVLPARRSSDACSHFVKHSRPNAHHRSFAYFLLPVPSSRSLSSISTSSSIIHFINTVDVSRHPSTYQSRSSKPTSYKRKSCRRTNNRKNRPTAPTTTMALNRPPQRNRSRKTTGNVLNRSVSVTRLQFYIIITNNGQQPSDLKGRRYFDIRRPVIRRTLFYRIFGRACFVPNMVPVRFIETRTTIPSNSSVVPPNSHGHLYVCILGTLSILFVKEKTKLICFLCCPQHFDYLYYQTKTEMNDVSSVLRCSLESLAIDFQY